MILYIERQAREYSATKHILSTLPYSQCVWIDHYKNLFDKQIWPYQIQECLIIAKTTGTSVFPVPPLYSPYPYNAFFRASINCPFDCSYCFLKGCFRNSIPVLFVNYEDIQSAILRHIDFLEQKKDTLKTKKDTTDRTCRNYYDSLGIKYCRFSSDYADGLVFDHFTQFSKYFIPFFEHLPGHLLEIRTKSINIHQLLSFFSTPPKNTEIAFSLNPHFVINNYEKKTPSLPERIAAINKLLSRGWKVGIRIMPILSFPDNFDHYKSFAEWLYNNLDRHQLHSFFIGGFILQHADYKVMKKKHVAPDLLTHLYLTDDRLWRIQEDQRKKIYRLFYDLFGEKIFVCMDTIDF